ncbi:MAG: ATP-binding protein, partial [Candidatus Omnitrophica bacterium]|nr:ATP-binding protein [Candidatus Omnitrophota bacterium]
LEAFYRLSKDRLFTVVIYGMRRIGKTELVRKFSEKKDFMYFFVYNKKTSKSLLDEFEGILKKKGVLAGLEKLASWEDFVDIIFQRCKGKIIVFDEFQNFKGVYPAIFSVLQRQIDENKDEKMMLVFLGSITGLIKKVFEDMKAPLYGRVKAKIKLVNLDYTNVREILSNLGYESEEDYIKFFSIFGGVPKYYAAIEDFGLNGKPFEEVLDYFFLKENAPFGYEVLDILRQEFGKRKGTYYTILEAIATGHTKLNEIASYTGLNITSINRYLKDLLEYYEIAGKKKPVTEGKKSKKSVYFIKDPVVGFWFKYIYKHLTLFEGKNYTELKEIIYRDINSHTGRNFEIICKEFLLSKGKNSGLPFTPSVIGNWWHGDKEIDLIVLGEKAKEILFAECKWSENVNAEKLLADLKEKAKFVNWNLGKRKETYCIIAKSFSSKPKLENTLLFDLEDLERFFNYSA